MIVLVRGGGDLASGVALRLFRSGLQVVITELAQPLTVRRSVAFSQAVYAGVTRVEDITARRVDDPESIVATLTAGQIPVLVDPEAKVRERLSPRVLVDARMTKRPPDLGMQAADLVIGLGPGFVAGDNCHAVVETKRGHTLGRVIWSGAAEPDTGHPEAVASRQDRVLRAPCAGVLEATLEIGALVEAGQIVAQVAGTSVRAPFQGVLRGMLHPGLEVPEGMKIGDLDPRGDPAYCRLVSDKALAIGGGVLEAILSWPELRPCLWD